ncbi:HlyD family secretion protein [Acidomonas methanolica]|uniref:Multidrug resistance efflux pump HlyD n=1 Tax=Acidomonas methanolica NBRC 104435 TaxID=1231351 RepID=A0A023DAD2_ACIMT|nr:HlyD family secretion protein [Acidomonas methanolica]MBU2655667.1 HlyD family secretion protein [Acidomonas methanolica]TCS21286.1 membrane fusion protein (multidrug efflux system) [Acidomonas methanolica]GAJ30771.1 multidrug resistance efflux pump HlyD [Acidomonas methanolica NBRC 104435]GEL00465.1 secretion protein [Acidomonas methanolica NBRC 104435]
MNGTTKILLVAAGVVILGAAAWSGDRLVLGDGVNVETNDAYVSAYSSVVAPKVGGRIDAVMAQDNERVRKGEVLAHIEDDDYRAALTVAQGNVVAARADIANLQAEFTRQDSLIAAARAAVEADDAQLAFARQDEARYRNLAAGGAGTTEQRQRTAAQTRETTAAKTRDEAAVQAATQEKNVLAARIERARGDLTRAEGEQRRAELDLSYCTIPAPVDGVVGARGVRVGNYVHPGSALMAITPVQDAFVVAHFQETQLTHVLPGQKATVWVDTFPGQPLHAHVDSIPPATGVAFAPIQPDNATGNFTKVVQRLPVRITFDPGQKLAERVRVGMSVEVRIDTASRPEGPKADDPRYAWR